MGAVSAIDRIADRRAALGDRHHLLRLMTIMTTGTGNGRIDISVLEVVFLSVLLRIIPINAGESPLCRPEQVCAIGHKALVGVMANRTLHDVLGLVHRLPSWRHLLDIGLIPQSQGCLTAAGIPLEEKFVRPERRTGCMGVGRGRSG